MCVRRILHFVMKFKCWNWCARGKLPNDTPLLIKVLCPTKSFLFKFSSFWNGPTHGRANLYGFGLSIIFGHWLLAKKKEEGNASILVRSKLIIKLNKNCQSNRNPTNATLYAIFSFHKPHSMCSISNWFLRNTAKNSSNFFCWWSE